MELGEEALRVKGGKTAMSKNEQNCQVVET